MSDLEPLTPEEQRDADQVETLLMRMIRERRHAFYDKAIELNIITPAQKTNLMVLHTLRDTEQRARDKEHDHTT